MRGDRHAKKQLRTNNSTSFLVETYHQLGNLLLSDGDRASLHRRLGHKREGTSLQLVLMGDAVFK